MIKKFYPFIKEYKKYLILGPLCVLIEVIAELLMPYLMSKIVDIGIPALDNGYILHIGIIMAVLAIIAIAFGCANMFFSSKSSMGFGANLRRAIFDKVQDFSFANIDKFSTASLVTRLTNDVYQIQSTIMLTLRLMVRAPLMFICALVLTLSINARLASIICISIPILLLAVYLILRRAYGLFQTMQQKLDNLNGKVQENLIGIRVVKSFVREDYEKDKFQQANNALMRAGLRAAGLVIILFPIMMLILNGTTIATIWVGGNMVGVGSMGTGELISFVSYIFQILISLMMISFVFMMLARSKASAIRIIEVLDTLPDIVEQQQTQVPVDNKERGKIEFRNVSFKYNRNSDNYVINNINFTARSGEVIAIVGATGSGKTTLVNLIPRLYDVSEGQILLNGMDIREYPLATLRQQIGMVLQKNVLFSGTIRENLLWGNQEANDEVISMAAQAAQAEEFINSFPGGYDSELGQSGVNLSGGQKQRLCIARAMLKDPAVLILDDSTSAVDSATEANLRESFHEDFKDTTVIIIAQRISSIVEADKILVLDDGRLVGFGNHQQLLTENQIYREIYNSQQEVIA